MKNLYQTYAGLSAKKLAQTSNNRITITKPHFRPMSIGRKLGFALSLEHLVRFVDKMSTFIGESCRATRKWTFAIKRRLDW